MSDPERERERKRDLNCFWRKKRSPLAGPRERERERRPNCSLRERRWVNLEIPDSGLREKNKNESIRIRDK